MHNVCANQVHQFAICTICIIYYTKYHTIQYWNHVLNRKKKDIQSNILEIFHGTSICQLFLKIEYISICVMCLLCAPCSSKQFQVQHVNFIMYVSKGSNCPPLKCTKLTLLRTWVPFRKMFTIRQPYSTMILKQNNNDNKIATCLISKHAKVVAFCQH